MTTDHFKMWQSRFAGDDYLFGTAPNAFLASCRELLPQHGRALAIADGEGRNGVFLAQCGLSVLSVDFSPAAQAKAQRLAAQRGVTIETETADLMSWQWPGGFDVIAGIFFQFVEQEQRPRIFKAIRDALNPGGLLLIQGYRPKQLMYKTGGPSCAENLYTSEVLEQSFGDFDNLSIREHDSEIVEGSAHAGMSALIDLIGWKPK
jgi:cyclopropane fatty-acyl-phospholipid synthase-like methyltransferase